MSAYLCLHASSPAYVVIVKGVALYVPMLSAGQLRQPVGMAHAFSAAAARLTSLQPCCDGKPPSLCRTPVATGKDPIVAISNTLYSSEDAASQAPAPSSEAATGGNMGDGEGLEDAEGADMVTLEGEVPQVDHLHSHALNTSTTAGAL